MKKELSTRFDTRQHMHDVSFEVFYYKDINPTHVSTHSHKHYELYFFLEGDVDYEIEDQTYPLEYGDYLMIPPDISHRPLFRRPDTVYRRFVLWISPAYYQSLCTTDSDFSYGFDYIKKERSYHFRSDFTQIQQIQGMLLELFEESRCSRAFQKLNTHLMAAALLVYLNRTLYDRRHQVSAVYSNVLYLNICDYINNHLADDLSLDTLSAFFYVSKYHISHIFKEYMGLSLHQYILKKRLSACRSGILADIPFSELSHQYGFQDYSSFYRAFKKEFGQSPTEFKEQHKLIAETPYVSL